MPRIEHTASVPTVASLEELQVLLDEAEGSGEPLEMTTSEWQRLRDEIAPAATTHAKAS